MGSGTVCGVSGFEAGPWEEGREGQAGGFLLAPTFLTDVGVTESDSLFALDVLRQRLREKIQEARGQVSWGGCWGVGSSVVFCSGFPALRGGESTLVPFVGLVLSSASLGSRCSHPCSSLARAMAVLVGRRSGVVSGILGRLSSHGNLLCIVCAVGSLCPWREAQSVEGSCLCWTRHRAALCPLNVTIAL